MKDKSAAIKAGGNKTKRKNSALVSKVGPDLDPNTTRDNSTISAKLTVYNRNEEWEVVVLLSSSTGKNREWKIEDQKEEFRKEGEGKHSLYFYVLLFIFDLI